MTQNALDWKKALSPAQRFLQVALACVRPGFVAEWLVKCLDCKRLPIRTKIGVFTVDPFSDLGRDLTRAGVYEPDMEETLRAYLNPGSVFVDLGANEGYFTVHGAKCVGASGRVVAVEPQSRLLPVIKENIRLNALTNVEVVSVAVSDEDAERDLYLSALSNTGASGLAEPSDCRSAESERVTAKRLGALLDELGLMQVDVMKMDIEGFEYEAVMGAVEVFQHKRIKALAIEIHGERLRDRGRDPMAVVRVLEAAGYRLETPHGCWVYVAQ